MAARRTLQQGDVGPDVVYLQKALGVPDDGEFGPVTNAQVRAFQAACGFHVNGVVGTETWAAVDELLRRMATGSDGVPARLQQSIEALAHNSAIQHFDWGDRGASPAGYIAGMGCCFALALTDLLAHKLYAVEMARAAGDPEDDALAYYADDFAEHGMSNDIAGAETLRHLFVMLIGLGMRESSGRYCAGKDQSADNNDAMTCEAGLQQTSWNINSASPNIPPLLTHYWDDPQGFLGTFRSGITPKTSEIECSGTGNGARYQFLSKYSPAFHVMVTGIGLRTRRSHWGPISREPHEVEIVPAADDYLKQVAVLVRSEPTDPPVPPDVITDAPVVGVSLTVPDGVTLRLTINGELMLQGDGD